MLARLLRCNMILSPLLLVAATGCLPYTMAATASTVPRDSVTLMVGMSSASTAITSRNEYDLRLPTIDTEVRLGVNDRSDAGVRITSFSGLLFSYKRRLVGGRDGAGLAAQADGGVLHFGAHGLAGLSLLASGREAWVVVPYAGARVMALAPLRSGAGRSAPVIGGFAGVRLRIGHYDVLPEVGVFRDPDVGDVTRRRWFVVPAAGLRITKYNPPERACRPGRWPRC